MANYYRSKKTNNIKGERFTPPGGWNKEFSNVFDFVVNGSGNGAIEAVAGGGKTSAIIESIIRWTEANPGKRALFVAFNVSIKEEGASRLAGYPVDVLTCHGLGYKAVMRSPWGRMYNIQGSKDDYMQAMAVAEFGDNKDSLDARNGFLEAISAAKTTLSFTSDEVSNVITQFGIDIGGYSLSSMTEKVIKALELTKNNPGAFSSTNKEGKKFTIPAITFDDQIWLPVVNNWRVDQYDAVFVDEAQDLSKARRELIKKTLAPGSRAFFCGDRYQAIYGWAGADIDSLPTIVKEFNCKELPLSCTWRCSKRIVAEAAKINPQITHAPNAKEGIVDQIESSDIFDNVKYGDAIVSRTNAPIIKLFFQFAKNNIKVKFIGKDYGKMLAFRLKSWKRRSEASGNNNFCANDVLMYNDEWLDSISQKVKTLSARIKDEYETIISIATDLNSNMNSPASFDEIIERCNKFSPDESKDSDVSKCITLSSTHRFKGLERRRVFVLIDTYSPSDDGSQEENNLLYVAQTRAKDHLTYVKGKGSVRPKR
jgi:hypothetical protein